MNCRRARQAIERRIDEQLGLERGFELDRHLQECEACTLAWQRAQELDEGLARLAEPPLQRLDVGAAVARIRERGVLEENSGPRTNARPRRQLQLAVSLAAAALIAVCFIWYQSPTANEDGGQRQPIVVVEQATDQVEQATPKAPGPALATPDVAPLDNQLLVRAREEVRTHLLVQAAPFHNGDIGAEEFALALDSATRDLRQLDWPVLRIVERLLEDPETVVAASAARYLGVRGDRGSRTQLARSLAREDIATQVTHAFADSGADGIDGLTLALQQPAQRELASEFLVAMNNAQAARAVASVYVAEQQPAGVDGSSPDLIETLVAMGPSALPALFKLGEDEWLTPAELCEVLEDIPSAGSALVTALHDRELSRSATRIRVQCAAVHAPASASRWLLAHIHDREWKDFALGEIAGLRGAAAVDAIVELDADSRLATRELAELVRRTLETDPRRFVTAIEQHAQIPTPQWHATLAERLVAAELPAAMPGVRALISSPQVEIDMRQELVLSLGEFGDDADLPLLAQVFDTCDEDQRQLAAACLIASERLGGEQALRSLLQGEDARTLSNLLHLLRRRKAGTRTTPSIYKLARELRPMLRARATDPRNAPS